MKANIDTSNYQGVALRGKSTVIVLQPAGVMTREQALVQAAWLVAIAEHMDGADLVTFEEVLDAVENT